MKNPEAVVIGSGPNGLAAAITVARAGHSVVVYEAESTIGGGARSAALTLPGFIHDVCSSVHPLGSSSPFFNSIPLSEFGLEWVFPEGCVAHPFDDGTAILVSRSLVETAAECGPDERAVRSLFQPFVASWDGLASDFLRPARMPRHPAIAARFAWNAWPSAAGFATRKFKSPKVRAVFAGMAAHSMMPLTSLGTSAFGLIFWTMCHAVGWPFARGGSQSIANALCASLEKLRGEIVTGRRIGSLDELPAASVVFCDVTPRQLMQVAGDRISKRERETLRRYRYGPGVFKVDWSLDAPIPWNATQCMKAGTVHLGGSLEEIVESERQAWGDAPASRPFVIVTQPSLFDPTRAPAGKHTAWGYCHVPNGSTIDATDAIESQVERFAAGFRRHVIGRSVMSPVDLQKHNANLIGGDIAGGSFLSSRLSLGFTRRAYLTSISGVVLCSSSTPPGAGVHGLCGYFAAQLALEKYLRK